MNVIHNYDARVFEALPEFEMAKQTLEGNREYLEELGRVICQHGLQEYIGISLLHKHFLVSPLEKLTKKFVGNEVRIRPMSSQDASKVAPYLWKLGTGQIG